MQPQVYRPFLITKSRRQAKQPKIKWKNQSSFETAATRTSLSFNSSSARRIEPKRLNGVGMGVAPIGIKHSPLSQSEAKTRLDHVVH